MNEAARRAVAYIAGRLATGKSVGAVYDYQAGGHTSMSGEVTEKRVSVFDHGVGCHVSGTRNGNRFGLYHYGNGNHINLEVKSGGTFTGYDYDSANHFDVTVKGSSVTLYDYAAGGWFNYSI
ncbi:MAG: hypothetical protein JWL79_3724 [Frankiales bacterium]|nr:hypothetical protein [Frankiales bacterium]